MMGCWSLDYWLIYLFDVFTSWFSLNGLRFMNRNGDLLLEDHLVSEESYPILEVRHHTVCCTPGSFAVGFVSVHSWGLLGFTTTCDLGYLLGGLVVQSQQESVLPRVVKTCHIWLV